MALRKVLAALLILLVFPVVGCGRAQPDDSSATPSATATTNAVTTTTTVSGIPTTVTEGSVTIESNTTTWGSSVTTISSVVVSESMPLQQTASQTASSSAYTTTAASVTTERTTRTAPTYYTTGTTTTYTTTRTITATKATVTQKPTTVTTTSKPTGGDTGSAPYPAYVRAEAERVAAKVRAVLKKDSIVSIKISDTHYGGQPGFAEDIQTNEGCLNACRAIELLTSLLPVDYVAHMGDVSKGTVMEDNATQKKQTTEFFGHLSKAVGNVPVFYTIGNHDTGIYYHNTQTKVDGEVHTLSGDWLYRNFTAHSASTNTVIAGKENGGYAYRDFPDKKLRVFLLNTSEKLIADQIDLGASESQRLWVAHALQELNTKSDAAEWGFVVLAHYALDYGDASGISNVFKAYVNGESVTLMGEKVNFSSNRAQFFAQFHGHYHCFVSDSLHGYRIFGRMEPYGVWRICTPNANYNSENRYTKPLYGLLYSEATKYPKTPDTAKETSFVVDVITPSEQVIYSFVYGAGYDRKFILAGKG